MSIAFYRDALGFELIQRYERQAAFLSAGGYHHHIGLNAWESRCPDSTFAQSVGRTRNVAAQQKQTALLKSRAEAAINLLLR